MPIKRGATKAFVREARTHAVPGGKKLKNLKNNSVCPDIVKALKENNAHLATALDECKQNFSDLLEDFVVLQEERQQLLERVVSLESKLTEQQRTISEQVQPVLNLLSQSEKSLSFARQTLAAFHSTKSSSGCHPKLFSPFLSPISGTAETHSKCFKPHSSTVLLQPKINNELSKPVQHRLKSKKFPKTPHPIIAVSTPEQTQGEEQGLETFPCVPRALDFDQEESVTAVNQAADTPLPTSVEPQDLVSEFRAAYNLPKVDESIEEVCESSDLGEMSGRQRPRRACTSLSLSYQEPSLKSKLTARDITNKNAHSSKLATKPVTVHRVRAHRDKDVSRVQSCCEPQSGQRQRPRRTCSTLNISYQEPSLKSKLRRGDSLTSVKTIHGQENNSHPPVSKSALSKIKTKSALQDVTNKRQ